MATGESSAPPDPAAHVPPTAPGPKPTRWGRILALIILLPVAAFALLIVIGMFAPKAKPTDATSVLREIAGNPARATEARIEGNLIETSPPIGPIGLEAEFLWTARPDGLDAEIYTFDAPMSATAAFEHLSEAGSLLTPAGDGGTDYSVTVSDPNGPAEKPYRCAQSSKEFACGSIPTGLPVVVILRRPLESEVQQYDSSDPMSAFRKMDQDKARTEAISSGMAEIDALLQRLGITAQPSAS